MAVLAKTESFRLSTPNGLRAPGGVPSYVSKSDVTLHHDSGLLRPAVARRVGRGSWTRRRGAGACRPYDYYGDNMSDDKADEDITDANGTDLYTDDSVERQAGMEDVVETGKSPPRWDVD